MKKLILMTALAGVASTNALLAQTPAVRSISTASAVSSEAFRAVGSVRELPGGKLLVNDVLARRVLLMDSAMHLLRVVVDSASANGGDSYGTRPGALVPYRADTTLFVDPVAYSMLVIDGAGNVVRARSVWRAQDAISVASPGAAIGQIGTDAKGRIVYRLNAPRIMNNMRPSAGVPMVAASPDTAFIVAADPDTRKVDTIAVIKIPATAMKINQSAGSVNISPVVNPLQITDEWAVLADGRVAVVRGRDYRVEYLNGDGTMTSSGKLPFDWQRLSDDDKQKVIDSTKVAQQKVALNEYATNMIRWVTQTGKEYPKDFTFPEGFVPQPGLPKDAVLPPGVKFPENYIYACPPGADNPAMMMGAGPPPGGMGAGGGMVITRVERADAGAGFGGAPAAASGCVPAPMMFSSGGPLPPPTLRTVEVVAPTDLPDYRPAFPAGSVRADRDGNLWVRSNPTKPVTGGPIFDIISPKGELVDRIQLPTGYAVVGFGKEKVVYLSSRDAAGIHVARVHLK